MQNGTACDDENSIACVSAERDRQHDGIGLVAPMSMSNPVKHEMLAWRTERNRAAKIRKRQLAFARQAAR